MKNYKKPDDKSLEDDKNPQGSMNIDPVLVSSVALTSGGSVLSLARASITSAALKDAHEAALISSISAELDNACDKDGLLTFKGEGKLSNFLKQNENDPALIKRVMAKACENLKNVKSIKITADSQLPFLPEPLSELPLDKLTVENTPHLKKIRSNTKDVDFRASFATDEKDAIQFPQATKVMFSNCQYKGVVHLPEMTNAHLVGCQNMVIAAFKLNELLCWASQKVVFVAPEVATVGIMGCADLGQLIFPGAKMVTVQTTEIEMLKVPTGCDVKGVDEKLVKRLDEGRVEFWKKELREKGQEALKEEFKDIPVPSKAKAETPKTRITLQTRSSQSSPTAGSEKRDSLAFGKLKTDQGTQNTN